MRLHHALLDSIRNADPVQRNFLAAAGVASIALLASFVMVVDAAVDNAPNRQAEIHARGVQFAAMRQAQFKRGGTDALAQAATAAEEAMATAHRISITGR